MTEYRLRPRAIADLDEIWDYTVEAWSEVQAERYEAPQAQGHPDPHSSERAQLALASRPIARN